MSRTSNDIYKLPDGKFVSLNQMQEPPQDARIWEGYDYRNQFWVHNGERDTRTLEDLQTARTIKRAREDIQPYGGTGNIFR